jgi:Tfp pilus assembly protein PilN
MMSLVKILFGLWYNYPKRRGFYMNGDLLFSLFPLITFVLCLAPVVFLIWYLLKSLKLQQERNMILKNISEKLEKENTKVGL